MPPRRKYGRIRIDGRTWRWTAMGTARAGSRTRAPDCDWVVCFRAVDDPMRSVRAELSPYESSELTEGMLRRLFSTGHDRYEDRERGRREAGV